MRGASEIVKLNRELDALSFVVGGGLAPAQKLSDADRRALRGELDRIIGRLVDLRSSLSS